MKPLLFAILCIFASLSIMGQDKTRPNILFIAVDDLRPELNFYGKKQVLSPTLDSLAATATTFTRSYCNIPVCGASRASILTGARPTRDRFINAHTYKDKDYPSAISLPMLLKQNGYTTISNGKIYHHKNDDKEAWDHIWKSSKQNNFSSSGEPVQIAEGERGLPYLVYEGNEEDLVDGDTTEKTIKDLTQLKKGNKPFFMAMGLAKPHLPFVAPKKYWDLYDKSTITLPSNYVQPESTPDRAFHNFGELRNYETIPRKGHLSEATSKELIRGYYACVSFIDAQIGKIIAELNRLDLADNTIIMLWGDHGWNLGEHQLWCKHCTFETSLRAPLLIHLPDDKVQRSIDDIVEFIDIYPTVCDLTGIERPKQLEGESLLPLIKGNKRIKNFAVSKFKDAVTLIRDNYFYTEWIDVEDKSIKDRMLFNHDTDPLELTNLAELPEYSNLVKQLSTELRNKWGKDF